MFISTAYTLQRRTGIPKPSQLHTSIWEDSCCHHRQRSHSRHSYRGISTERDRYKRCARQTHLQTLLSPSFRRLSAPLDSVRAARSSWRSLSRPAGALGFRTFNRYRRLSLDAARIKQSLILTQYGEDMMEVERQATMSRRTVRNRDFIGRPCSHGKLDILPALHLRK